MFGTGETFDYAFCTSCGTFQIKEIPADLSKYYKSDTYYSFNNRTSEPLWRNMAKRAVAAIIVGRPHRFPTGDSIVDRVRTGCEPWIANIPRLAFDSRILDVGCGQGSRLASVARLGFTDLSGIDPFLPSDRQGRTPEGIMLYRGELADHDLTYDVVTMHHSLEHVPDPFAVLRAARARLAPGGSVFVRIPLFQREVWERFGTNWTQIDAPRHLYLFTPHAFVELAQRAGFDVVHSGTDSFGKSLALSAAHGRGITVMNEAGAPNPLPFSQREMAGFAADARRLNREGKGDQGYFVLQPRHGFDSAPLH